MGTVDSYGCGALIAVAGYHLFPDFIGGADEEARKQGIVSNRRVLQELMKLRGAGAVIAGERPSLVVFFVAPICFLVPLTADASEVFAGGWLRQMAGADTGNAALPSEGAPV
jgi:glutathione S-transferase